MSLDDAQAKIEAWRRDYDENRPFSALDWRTPKEFARQIGPRPGLAQNMGPEIPTCERQEYWVRVTTSEFIIWRGTAVRAGSLPIRPEAKHG